MPVTPLTDGMYSSHMPEREDFFYSLFVGLLSVITIISHVEEILEDLSCCSKLAPVIEEEG